MQKYMRALNSGTTSNRGILFNHRGEITDTAQQEFEQIYPHPEWVEHRPSDIWENNQDLQYLFFY
ncbi:FGGY family of carbohydrate kinases, N-terminal domain [Tangfeifania diversioriginum]|uniref:FGGY family of carbohydrate kinases, N-terminal domain n=1 Tax=Tangfeifania diversioriginum TaxID=1168035 RepID=A0A1M6A3G7_9BACT|nr:FGGY family carbohydrate kinase [Tangfeifania diversioriginum]SHI31044.1 FGGY family of carbohydrate kinases, N-terminal domain [Tangfeifania diversioriginum]